MKLAKNKMKRKANLEDYGFVVVKRPKIVYHISSLPNETIKKIFNYLSPHDRRQAMLVCVFWMELVNEYFPKDNCIVVSIHTNFSPTGDLYQTFHARLTTTKTKRNFSGLRIIWFPENDEKRQSLSKFITLICDEIRYLYIPDEYHCLKDNFINHKIYAQIPKLEKLQIARESFLGDLVIPLNLKSIELDGILENLQKLKRIQDMQNIENFTAKSIKICEKDINNEALVSFIDPNLKVSLVDMMGNYAHGKNYIELTTNFNYCGEDKLMPKDVSEISLHTNKINISSLAQFNNLKDLKIRIANENAVLHSNSHNQITYFGITSLQIHGSFINLDNFHHLLKCFPDLENLLLKGMMLKDCDFTAICESMPKLKSLKFYGIHSEISITTVFATDNFSLKNLKFLEELVIKTKSESYDSPNIEWPDLHHLKIFHINGEGCRYFDRNFFTEVSQKSPNLNSIDIGYNNNNYLDIDSSKFLPILSSQLTELTLPGEGGNASDVHYAEFIENVVRVCKNLENFGVNDGLGFSLSQEIDLFKRLPNLSYISCENKSLDSCREFGRSDLVDLKTYLNEYLHLYQDLTGTLNYLFNNHIPYHDRIKMENSYDANFADEGGENFKICYIVTHDYLKMSPFKLWKIFYHHTLTD